MPSQKNIELKLEQQLRESNVETKANEQEISTLVERIEKGTLNIHPPFQRGYVWAQVQASRLVESILMRCQIPMIFTVRTMESGRPVDLVIDGQQRLTSLYNFIKNINFWNPDQDFRLTGCRKVTALNRLRYAELPVKYQQILQDHLLYVCKVHGGERENIVDYFSRLNQDSVKLTAQEARNAIYWGPFNDLLKQCASDPRFVTHLSVKQKTRMGGVELALRFFAFERQGIEGYLENSKGNMGDFLESEMRFWHDIKLVEGEAQILHGKWDYVMTLTEAVFGAAAFRKNPEAKQITNALVELILCGFIGRDPLKVTENAEAIKTALFQLCATNAEFLDSIEHATNWKQQVVRRFTIWGEALDAILGPLEMPAPAKLPCALVELTQVVLIPDEEEPVVPKLPALVSQESLRKFVRDYVKAEDRVCSDCGQVITEKQLDVAQIDFDITTQETALYHSECPKVPELELVSVGD